MMAFLSVLWQMGQSRALPISSNSCRTAHIISLMEDLVAVVVDACAAIAASPSEDLVACAGVVAASPEMAGDSNGSDCFSSDVHDNSPGASSTPSTASIP